MKDPPFRPLRAWLAALVLAAVSAGTLLDGGAPDFVAGEGDDAVAAAVPAAPAFSAVQRMRSPDLFAARRPLRSLAAVALRAIVRFTTAFLSLVPPAASQDISTPDPLPSRAPPVL